MAKEPITPVLVGVGGMRMKTDTREEGFTLRLINWDGGVGVGGQERGTHLDSCKCFMDQPAQLCREDI